MNGTNDSRDIIIIRYGGKTTNVVTAVGFLEFYFCTVKYITFIFILCIKGCNVRYEIYVLYDFIAFVSIFLYLQKQHNY